MKEELKDIGTPKSKHNTLLFISIFIITIIATRISVLFFDPNPVLMGFELHHFDYGLTILTAITFLLLFDKKRRIYIFLSAISLALVVDEIWFVRKNLYENPGLYSATIPATLIIITTTIAGIMIFEHIKGKNEKHNKKTKRT